MDTKIETLEELRACNLHHYCEIFNEKDYEIYKEIVRVHNEQKKQKKPIPGDLIICKSLDGEKVYNRGRIENSDISDFSSICVGPMIPFISARDGEISTSTSGGYWFSEDPKKLKHVGYGTATFNQFGRCGAQANGAFYFNLNVNIWEIVSKEVY